MVQSTLDSGEENKALSTCPYGAHESMHNRGRDQSSDLISAKFSCLTLANKLF